jgi:hypothetical protein
MPPFAPVLQDADVAALLSFLRASWGNRAGPVSALDVARARAGATEPEGDCGTKRREARGRVRTGCRRPCCRSRCSTSPPASRRAGRTRRRRRTLVAATTAAAAIAGARRRRAHAFAAAEHLHLLGDDLGGELLGAVLVGPLARLQATFDVDRRPFFRYSPAISASGR